jgi:DNA repair protein RadD
LVKTLLYAPVIPDLRGVQTRQGDYVEAQLAARMDRDTLVGDIVTHWHKFGKRRRTVCFAVNVGHSQHIANEFNRAGVPAEHLDGNTPLYERAAILARLASGETQVVCNCMVLTEGFNCPDIGCLILARPTKRLGLYRQMIGRALRTADGKSDAIILDHSGAYARHGLPEDRVLWTLDPDKHAVAPEHQKRLSEHHKGSGLIECTQCTAMRLGGKPCPACGFMPKRPAEYIRITDGELGLIDRRGRAQAEPHDPACRATWHGMFAWIGNERGFRMPGYAKAKYREKFGDWPPYGSNPQPVKPTPECLSWVRSRAIAYAKAKQRDAA